MTTPLPTSEIREFLNHHLMDVFQTMFSLKVTFIGQVDRPPQGDRVSGSVGFGGETVTGAVYLHLSHSLATRAAGMMLGFEPPQQAGDADINDAIGEVTNMLGGGFKSWLCDMEIPCAMSAPAIIRGTAFDIESVPEVDRMCLSFDCENERVLFELHLKFI